MIDELSDDELRQHVMRASLVLADARDALDTYADGRRLEPEYAKALAKRVEDADDGLQNVAIELLRRSRKA